MKSAASGSFFAAVGDHDTGCWRRPFARLDGCWPYPWANAQLRWWLAAALVDLMAVNGHLPKRKRYSWTAPDSRGSIA